MKFPLFYLILAANIFTSALCAQDTQRHFTQKLWPDAAPGALVHPSYRETTLLRDNDPAKPRITQVTEPALEFFLPAPENANGSAVVVCPGGGYAVLAYDHEGIQIGKWFAARGVAAAILKYRLPHSDIMEDKSVGPLQDAQEAIRYLRRHANELHISTARIGIMGFSAGGHLAASATTRHAEKIYAVSDECSARPDFSILVYPVISMQSEITHAGSRENLLGATPDKAAVDRASNELRVDDFTPPCFLVHAQDDKTVPVENSLRFYSALTRAGIAGELHIYEKGGHGFGLGISLNTPDHWPRDLEVWMTRNDWLGTPKQNHPSSIETLKTQAGGAASKKSSKP